MEPAMPTHSLILVERVNAADVRVGQIITFDPPGPTPRVTHRVVARTFKGGRWYFTTKGDANPAPDDWRRGLVHPERYERGISYAGGRAVRQVATIPYAGYAAELGAFPRLRAALVLLPFAGIAFSLLLAIWRRPARP
jgi:signal peptidase I